MNHARLFHGGRWVGHAVLCAEQTTEQQIRRLDVAGLEHDASLRGIRDINQNKIDYNLMQVFLCTKKTGRIEGFVSFHLFLFCRPTVSFGVSTNFCSASTSSQHRHSGGSLCAARQAGASRQSARTRVREQGFRGIQQIGERRVSIFYVVRQHVGPRTRHARA